MLICGGQLTDAVQTVLSVLVARPLVSLTQSVPPASSATACAVIFNEPLGQLTCQQPSAKVDVWPAAMLKGSTAGLAHATKVTGVPTESVTVRLVTMRL